MERHGGFLMAFLFLFFIVAVDVSDASLASKLRISVATTATFLSPTTTQLSLSPSPVPVPVQQVDNNTTVNGTSSEAAQLPNGMSSKVNSPMELDSTAMGGSVGLPPPDKSSMVNPMEFNSTATGGSVALPPPDKTSMVSPMEFNSTAMVGSVGLPPPDKPSKVNPKEFDSTTMGGSVGLPQPNQSDVEMDEVATEERKDRKADLDPEEVGLNCTGVAKRCRDGGSLVACILGVDTESNKLLILVQNEGHDMLSVDVAAGNSTDNALLEIYGHRSTKIDMSVDKGVEVLLKAGNGPCVLHTDLLVSQGNFFLNLPSYDKLVTPINGAYFLIFTVTVFGGTWACCMLTKRRRQGGVPYQELEMAMPETGLANNEEPTGGWDKGWDDDWDEENAVMSPAARRAASISANGLTSRAANKDGWENDWDN